MNLRAEIGESFTTVLTNDGLRFMTVLVLHDLTIDQVKELTEKTDSNGSVEVTLV